MSLEKLTTIKFLEATHIRMARAGANLTVRELAVLSGINKATIVRIEAGYPVREASLNAVKETLESNGVKFLMCSASKDILIGAETRVNG